MTSVVTRYSFFFFHSTPSMVRSLRNIVDGSNRLQQWDTHIMQESPLNALMCCLDYRYTKSGNMSLFGEQLEILLLSPDSALNLLFLSSSSRKSRTLYIFLVIGFALLQWAIIFCKGHTVFSMCAIYGIWNTSLTKHRSIYCSCYPYVTMIQ